MVACFGATEIVIELRELGFEPGGSDHAQPLTTSSLDDARNQQAIDQDCVTPAGAYALEQLVHVLVLVVWLQREPPCGDHAEHAVKVFELFASELDQRLEQHLPIGVLDHEGHPRRRSLAFTGGVIQQKCIEIAENDVQPGRRGGYAQIQHIARTLRALRSRANEAMLPSSEPDRRIAIAIIRRKNGDYFAHQRLASKRQYPNLFGVGAGGSCEPGEPPDVAAARELKEETGLSGTLLPLFSLDYREPGTFHELFVFELTTDASPGHDASEWQWSGWLTASELAELAQDGKLCPDTAAVLARYWQLGGQ